MGLNFTPACRGARQWVGSASCTRWSELKAAEAFEGSSGVVHVAAVPSVLSLSSFVPAEKRSYWSDMKITPAQPRETHQKMTPGSVTFSVTVNPCIIPSWLRSWHLWLSKPLPCWVLVSLLGFQVAHFPHFKPLFCLESDMANPCVTQWLCPPAAGSKSTSCIRCPTSCSLADSRWGLLCRHQLQACEILQRHHIPMPLHRLLMGWCTSKHHLSSKVSFCALSQNMTLCSSQCGNFYQLNGAGIPLVILVTLCYLFKKRKKETVRYMQQGF